ncbi:MAG: Gfo/Idh/MocA family oxidoreductase, partial [Nitrospirota bacterium]|nr:Gfo/Idh/MocA family oxidoreductase [Nitrospirota bacterium]
MMENKKFIGLVGLGYWGKNIMRNLHELGVLHTACDSSAATIEERRRQFPDVRYTISFEDLLADSEIKAVAIAAPAAMHYDLIKRALLAGKDVFVEKPLALTVKEGEELVALAEGERKILMVGHILQYHPAVIKLKNMIASGELGRVEYIYSNRLNIGKLRTEENILWSFAPHDISIVLMLLGEEPVKVTATGGAYLSKGIYDTTLTSMEFRNGVKGHIFVSWLHPYKEQKLVVVGSKAMVVFDDGSKEKLSLYPHTIEWKDGKIPVAQKVDHQAIPLDNGEPLKAELSHFVECVLERKRPLTDGREGLNVLKVLEMAERSLTSGNPQSGLSLNPSTPAFVHDTALVDNGVSIGSGTKIWHFSHVLKGSRIGD